MQQFAQGVVADVGCGVAPEPVLKLSVVEQVGADEAGYAPIELGRAWLDADMDFGRRC